MAENTAQTASDWVLVARSVAQLPDSRNQALHCMARAQLAARGVSDWIALATAWQQDFNDPAIARQCLEKAEGLAKDEDWDDYVDCDWEQIANLWMEMGDYPKAIKIYRECDEARPWSYLTELEEIYGGRTDGTTVLDWVEPGMTGRASGDAVSSADGYFSNNNYAMVIDSLLEAESFASYTRDWIRIANRWRDYFSDSDSASWCMAEAETVVDVPGDWIRLAKTWKHGFQDSDRAIQCLTEAERGGTEDDWEEILRIWKDDFQDPDRYLLCVKKCADDFGANGEPYWNCIREALYDDFVYSRFIGEQKAFTDLGTLTGSIPDSIETWDHECTAELQPGSRSRFYRFELEEPAEIAIYLKTDGDSYYSVSVDPYIILRRGDSTTGEVLDKDLEGYRYEYQINRDLLPGTYVIEATNDEKGADIFFFEVSYHPKADTYPQ